MKKLITIFILIILFLFVSKYVIVLIDKNNIDSIKEGIYNNTNIEDIEYVNFYDNYYLVLNDNYLYLLDFDYKEISKIEVDKLYNNKNNYDLVYRDNKILYMDNYINDEGISFKYYDIYTYELIDEILVGGN